MRVLDASAIINVNQYEYGECYTTQSVIDEIRDAKSRAIATAAIAQHRLRIAEPLSEYVERVRRVARRIGSAHKLSQTDLEIAALALQMGAILVTDDWTLQNLAAHLGIRFEGVVRGSIRRKRTFR